MFCRADLFCILMLGVVATAFSPNPYNNFCQHWCYGQSPIIGHQLCTTYCGEYSGNYGNPCNQGNVECTGGLEYPGNPRYPNCYGVYNPCCNPYPGYPVYPPPAPFPSPPLIWPDRPVIDIVSPNNINNGAIKPMEWMCPVDRQPRSALPNNLEDPSLVVCLYDENCISSPKRQKCCYDTGVGAKVCKPAILG